MPENVIPVGLERVGDNRLRIEWSDGQRREYRAVELRDACPCATCREKHSAPAPSPMQLNVLSAAEAKPLAIRGMRPVGAYAYNIAFSDGHDTGLYTFDRLLGLGAPDNDTAV